MKDPASAKVAANSKRGSKPGERRGGRQKGTPNKLTTTVRQAIIESFNELGGKDWLKKLAKSDRKTYATLLGKAMPTEVSGPDGAPIALAVTGLDLSSLTEEELDRRIAEGAKGRKAPKAAKG